MDKSTIALGEVKDNDIIFKSDKAIDAVRHAQTAMDKVGKVYWLCESKKLTLRQQDLVDNIDLALRKLVSTF